MASSITLRNFVAHADHGGGSLAPLLKHQARRRAVQRLDPAIFIGAQHDGVFRRVQIDPDGGLRLLGELGIVGNMLFDPDRRMNGAWFWFRISLASRTLGSRPCRQVDYLQRLLARSLPKTVKNVGVCPRQHVAIMWDSYV